MTVDQVLATVGIVASAIMVGIGGAMAWFRSVRMKIEADVESLRCEIRSTLDEHHENDKDIAVLQTEVRNNVDRLEEINGKLDQVGSTLTQMLLAIQQRR